MDQYFETAFNETTWIFHKPLALELKIARSALENAMNDTYGSFKAVIDKHGGLNISGAPYIISEATLDNPYLQNWLHKNTVDKLFRYDS